MKKTVFLCCILCLSLPDAKSQTALIAHKSHSGSLETFHPSKYEDNFGNPPKYMDSVVKLSDTSVIEYGREWDYFSDTVYHHPHFNNKKIGLDSLKKMYRRTKLIGFEDQRNNNQQQNQNQNQNQQQRPDQQHLITPGINPGKGPGTGIFLLALMAFSCIFGFALWRRNKHQLARI